MGGLASSHALGQHGTCPATRGPVDKTEPRGASALRSPLAPARGPRRGWGTRVGTQNPGLEWGGCGGRVTGESRGPRPAHQLLQARPRGSLHPPLSPFRGHTSRPALVWLWARTREALWAAGSRHRPRPASDSGLEAWGPAAAFAAVAGGTPASSADVRVPGLSGALLGRLKTQFWGGGCHPRLQQGPQGRPGSLGLGASSSSEGHPALGTGAWCASPEPRCTEQEPHCVCLSSAPMPGEAPEGHGCVPAQPGLGAGSPQTWETAWAQLGAPGAPLFPPPPSVTCPQFLGGHMGCFPHLSSSPWAADSVPLPQPRA